MSEKCKKAFGLSTPTAMRGELAFVDKMTFHEGRLPGNMDMLGAHGGLNDFTFAEYHANALSAQATTLLDATLKPSTHIVLWHDFFGGRLPNSLAAQRVTLVHEFGHSWFRLGNENHLDIATRLGIPVAGSNGTAALDKWLETCW